MKIVATTEAGVVAVSPLISANNTWSRPPTISDHPLLSEVTDESSSPSVVSSWHHTLQSGPSSAPAVMSQHETRRANNGTHLPSTARTFLTPDVSFGLLMGMCVLCGVLVVVVVVCVMNPVIKRRNDKPAVVTDVQLDVESSSSWNPRAIYI
jgi:hypothetical protein